MRTDIGHGGLLQIGRGSLLPLVMLGSAALLAGCGGDSTGTTTSSSTTGSSTSTSVTCGTTSSGVANSVLTVAASDTCTVSATTALNSVVIGTGGHVVAPSGYDVTLTVDGVETGQAWSSISDVGGTLQAGTYASAATGGVVLTVTTQTTQTGSSDVFPIRQALFVNSGGIVSDYSVAAAWTLGATPGAASATGLVLKSTGSTFNGVWVDGTPYALTNAAISMTGNGRSDFVGDGAAIVGVNGAAVTVDGLALDNQGVVRTAVVSDSGSNVVVKNSTIAVKGGTLPSDYVANVAFDTMVAAPWMLGLEGTNRATLLLGASSKAAYINTSLTAQDWGVLSTDSGSNVKLAAINSSVVTQDSGYGTYAIGSATSELLGTDFDVSTYLSISANGSNVVHFGNSTAAAVAALNTANAIGLSDTELAALPEKAPTLISHKYGFMTWAGNNTVNVDGGAVVFTVNALFEDKSQTGTTVYNVTGDSSAAPSLMAANGVIVQVMNQDDPGPGGSYTDATGVTQSTTAATRASTSLAAQTSVNLTGVSISGDFFNGVTTSKNLILALSGSTITGRVSTTTTAHAGTVNEANYTRIGDVTNTVTAPINGGAIVQLTNGSTWNVTGTAYVTSLTVDATSTFNGIASLNGSTFVPVAGVTYTGDILVQAN